MNITSDGIKASIRPIVTMTFVLGQVGLAVMWATSTAHAEQAFAGLSAFTMMIIKDYFDARKVLEQSVGVIPVVTTNNDNTK